MSWRYVRDANFASGMDGAILDNVYVPLVIPPPTNVAPARLMLTLQANGVATIQVTGTPGARYITEASTNTSPFGLRLPPTSSRKNPP
jgi:hypothetical protein